MAAVYRTTETAIWRSSNRNGRRFTFSQDTRARKGRAASVLHGLTRPWHPRNLHGDIGPRKEFPLSCEASRAAWHETYTAQLRC